jgi:hypothetical protein
MFNGRYKSLTIAACCFKASRLLVAEKLLMSLTVGPILAGALQMSKRII